jgi:transcriptional regulator with XRE-family HTH domain
MAKAKEMTQEEEERWAALGAHLKALREGQRWTQDKLASKANGVSVATIRAIETRTPKWKRHRLTTLTALSKALGNPEDYLANYLRNASTEEEPSADPDTEGTEHLPQPSVEFIVARMDEIIVSRLNEIVVPRLNALPGVIYDIFYNIERPDEAHDEDPGDSE